MVIYTLDVNLFVEKLSKTEDEESFCSFSDEEIKFFNFAKERNSNDVSLDDLNSFLFNLHDLCGKFKNLNQEMNSNLQRIESASNVKGRNRNWW